MTWFDLNPNNWSSGDFAFMAWACVTLSGLTGALAIAGAVPPSFPLVGACGAVLFAGRALWERAKERRARSEDDGEHRA